MKIKNLNILFSEFRELGLEFKKAGDRFIIKIKVVVRLLPFVEQPYWQSPEYDAISNLVGAQEHDEVEMAYA